MNRCEADRERIKRAAADCGLVERTGVMERRIYFEVGYDHRAFPEDCGGGGHGRHGMNMRWLLIGPAGAAAWLVYMTNWFPGNVSHGNVEAGEPVSLIPVDHPDLGDGMAAELRFHSPVRPEWDTTDWLVRNECEYLPGGYCYSDLTASGAEPVLDAFLEHGPHAVWASLARFYSETFGEQS